MEFHFLFAFDFDFELLSLRSRNQIQIGSFLMWKNHGNTTQFIVFKVFLSFPIFLIFSSASFLSFSVDDFIFQSVICNGPKAFICYERVSKQIVWLWSLIGNRNTDFITVRLDECEQLSVFGFGIFGIKLSIKWGHWKRCEHIQSSLLTIGRRMFSNQK